MTKHARIALAAVLVMGWLVVGTAAQERREPLNIRAAQGKTLSPENKEKAEKFGTWLQGSAFFKNGDYEKAAEVYKQAIRRWPDDAHWHYLLGMADRELGRYQEAADAYKQAIRLKPDDVLAHYNLGMVYLILKDRAAALEEYKILQTLDKEKANNLFNSIHK